jgi:polysaccharide biosynthesis protein PelB
VFTATNLQLPQESISWYQSAAKVERQRLFGRGLIPAFLALMLAILWMTLPSKDLSERLAHAERSDLLTVAYLRTWLVAKPNEWPLYLTLAKHHMLLGDTKEAIAALEQLKKFAGNDESTLELRIQAAMMKIQVLERKAFTLNSSSLERHTLLNLVRDELQMLVNQPLTSSQLSELTEIALSIGDTESLRALFRRVLAKAGAMQSESWFNNQAKIAMGLGEYSIAIDLAWRAFALARTDATRLEAFFIATHYVRAGDLLKAQIESIDKRASRLPPTRSVLEFMIRLAMAAGRTDIAEKYAYRLLQFSAFERLQKNATGQHDFSIVRVTTAIAPNERTEPLSKPAQTPHLVFDDEAYTLAFNVFIANRNQKDALIVAETAVKQTPTNLVWRKRLAQLGDWMNKPQLALEHWRYLAEHDHSSASWENVKRLAIGLNDNDANLGYIRWQIRTNPSNVSLDLVYSTQLENMGQPEQAIQWLESKLRERGNKGQERIVDGLVALAVRTENFDMEIAWLQYAIKHYGTDFKKIERIAWLQIVLGKNDLAWATLDKLIDFSEGSQKLKAPASFWRLYIGMANGQGKIDKVLKAYAELTTSNSLSPQDWYDVLSLVEARSIQGANSILQYLTQQRIGNQRELLQRLFLSYLQMGQLDKVNELLTTLEPAQKTAFESNPLFLKLRANYYQSVGLSALAAADLRKIVSSDPFDDSSKAALVWIQIANRDLQPLTQSLRRWDKQAKKDQDLSGAFAAAYMTLNQPQKAIPFLKLKSKSQRDYLWNLAYADALSQIGFQDMAWSIRRHVWLQVAPKANMLNDSNFSKQQTIASLAMQFATGDASKNLVRQVFLNASLRSTDPTQLRTESVPEQLTTLPAITALISSSALLAETDEKGSTELNASETPSQRQQTKTGAKELALSYLMSSEQLDAARAWLLSRYADELSKPAWAQLTLALDQKDQLSLMRLLDDVPDWLPRMDRIEALKQTKQYAQAQTLAFQTLEERPWNDTAHQLLSDLLLLSPSMLRYNATKGSQAGLKYLEHHLDGKLKLSGRHSLKLQVDSTALTTQNTSILGISASQSKHISLGINSLHENSISNLFLTNLQSLRSVSGAKGDWLAKYGALNLNLSGGFHQIPLELPTLRIGGLKNYLNINATYNPTARDYFSATVGVSQFQDQDKTSLAKGSIYSLEYGHRLRIDYPDITIKTILSSSQYRQQASAANSTIVPLLAPGGVNNPDPLKIFIPQGSNEFGINLSVGQSARSTYSRAFRPFAEFGLRQNSISGVGYNAGIGLTTSILGADFLSIYLSGASKTPGVTKGKSEIGISYQYFF